MKEDISILVVDDEEMMQRLLRKILSHDGYQVVTASSGEAALEILASQDIAILISDLSMPGMGGFELLKIVKERHPRTAVIMMTAFGDTYTVKDALLLGADEYVTKPFKSFEISMVVERAYWRLLSQNRQTAPPAE
jgi:DNA-binding NtrC family response regulator